MGSIPNGSAPLQACARQIFNSMLPGRTGKAQVRLAAAGRLRSAVALELAAGKVWALPKTVQIQLVGSSGATARATLNGLGATARAPAPSPTTLAEGRSCFGVGPTRKPVTKGSKAHATGCLRSRAGSAPLARRRGGAAGWTLSPGTTSPTA